MKKCIILITVFLFCSCTIVKYEANDKKFSWTSTKKVLITVEGEKLSISTDPDSQYIMTSKLIELAGSVK